MEILLMTQTIRGFTLSELLVSLAVLGLISALTLPKIFTNVENLKKKAVFKETFMVLQKMYTTNYSNGGTYIRAAQLGTINATRICGGISADDMVCETRTIEGEETDLNNQGFILPSGAHVWAFDPDRFSMDTLAIDWNGHAGNNTIGDDIMIVNACIDPEVWVGPGHSCASCAHFMRNPIPGGIEPFGAVSVAMFDTMMGYTP